MLSLQEQKLKNELLCLNTLGKSIINMSKVLDQLNPEDQTDYAREILNLTQLYLRYVKEVEKIVNDLREEEKTQNLPASLKIKRIQKELAKFNHHLPYLYH